MKKIHIQALAVFVFSLIMFYLLGCFIYASFDIAAWDIVFRGFIGVGGLILSAMFGAIVLIECVDK